MPDEIRKIIKKNSGRYCRQKANGVYELRLTYKGNHFYGCSKNLNEAKRQFLESIVHAFAHAPQEELAMQESTQEQNLDLAVSEYAYHYLEVFKKPNICEMAYKNYTGEIKNHIEPHFIGKKVSEITATACQQLLNALLCAGKGRIAEDVKNLLKWICSAAVADGFLKNNPMTSVQILKHRRKTGKQIPVEIMEKSFSTPPKDRYDICIMLMAYSGVRPCEISTIKIDGNFFVIKNAKQGKNEEPTFRRIPVHSALIPYLNKIKENLTINTDVLGQVFHKRFSKDYRLYDLRHTFTSRIQECGANKSWVDYATAHTSEANTTTRVYTHWSDTFQVSEMEKLNYKSHNQSQN